MNIAETDKGKPPCGEPCFEKCDALYLIYVFFLVLVAPYSGWSRVRDVLSIIALAGGLTYAAYRFYKV